MKVLEKMFFFRTLNVMLSIWLAIILAASALHLSSFDADLTLESVIASTSLNAVRVFPIVVVVASALLLQGLMRERAFVLLGSSAVGLGPMIKGALLAIALLSATLLCIEHTTAEAQEGSSWFSSRDKRAERHNTLLMIGDRHALSARVLRGAQMRMEEASGLVADVSYHHSARYSAQAIEFDDANRPKAMGLRENGAPSLQGGWKAIHPRKIRTALGQVGSLPLASAITSFRDRQDNRNTLSLYLAIMRLLTPFAVLFSALLLAQSASTERTHLRIIFFLISSMTLYGGEKWLVQSALQGFISPEFVFLSLIAGTAILVMAHWRVGKIP